MIHAIVFDCFGVLTTDGWLPFKEKYFSHSQELLQQATDLNKQMDSGLMGFEEFVQNVANLAKIPEAEARTAIENNVTNERLFDYIHDELKAHYRLGVLSNAGANWLAELFSTEQVRLFDAVSLSYESGFVKPDERAYQDIADKLEVSVEECVLVDDQPRYCEAARDIGMQAILYTDFAAFRAQLESMLTASAE
jgi:HAD superfamily hydrolase (TIGR01509 family)